MKVQQKSGGQNTLSTLCLLAPLSTWPYVTRILLRGMADGALQVRDQQHFGTEIIKTLTLGSVGAIRLPG